MTKVRIFAQINETMNVEQLYTGCLAQGAYYIESEGEVAIIDPLRETLPYIEKARDMGATIKYIFETHFHADFVSGHIDLARKTGADIVYGPGANTEFEIIESEDGQEFELGKVKIKVLHTPGHTPESSTFLLIDENGKEHAIFSGDTLFIGDVGRPDLAVKSDLSQEDLAGMLFDSLRNKIMTLPDDVVVYPGHGAGSACGKNMSKETTDLLGNQKNVNYALRVDMSKDEFIKEVTEGILPPPQYFPKNARMNREGYRPFDHIMVEGKKQLTVADVMEAANNGAVILDTRDQADYAKGHIPRSIFIGIDGGFAPWVGTLLPDIEQRIIIVAEKGREEEVITRLARVGYDNTIGYLEGGIDAWIEAGREVDTVRNISAEEFEMEWKKAKIHVVDVRKPGEYLAEHIDKAFHAPLDYINDHLKAFDPELDNYIHCAGGYRSMIAASILKARGIHNLVNVNGGFNEILETEITVTDYVCPSTVLN
jgi:glyoxylase-like metal-dependent hydrolase (beta-lactamase superfamily II)/rhodanese-related sulfurtransferase